MTQRLTRPPEGASTEARQQFGGDLYAALDLLGVEPGETFFVMAPGGQAKARTEDPDTSHAAAASLDDLKKTQQAVFRIFREWRAPMTDEQLEQRYVEASQGNIVPEQSPSGIRSRRSELRDAGLIVDTGEKARNSHGNQAILWGLADPEWTEVKPGEKPSDTLFDSPAIEAPRRRYGNEEAR